MQIDKMIEHMETAATAMEAAVAERGNKRGEDGWNCSEEQTLRFYRALRRISSSRSVLLMPQLSNEVLKKL